MKKKSSKKVTPKTQKTANNASSKELNKIISVIPSIEETIKELHKKSDLQFAEITNLNKFSRKDALILAAGIGIPAVMSYFSNPIQIALSQGLNPYSQKVADKDLLNQFVNINNDIRLFAGNTNLIRETEGRPGLSPYMQFASASFTGYIKRITSGNTIINEVNSEASILQMTTNEDVILLGGPVANKYHAIFSGYEYKDIKYSNSKTILPIFNSQKGFRWGFYCGQNTYGENKGIQYTVNRYEKGNLVNRPLYGIIDSQHPKNSIKYFNSDENDFLTHESLIIIKRPNPFNLSNSIFIIAGMHGYSTEEFVTDLHTNLERLSYLTNNTKYYQINIPVSLEHVHAKKITIGHIEWNNAEMEALL